MHITDYTKTDALTALSLFIFDAGNDIGTRTMFAKDLANALLQFADAGRLSKDLKLSEMPVAQEVAGSDKIFLGTDDGNKVVPVSDIFDIIDAFATVETRNNVFRGKNLGSSVTPEQYEEIRNGTFGGMFVGDYWEINNTMWRIIDFDYYYSSGRFECNQEHHIVIAPDTSLGSGAMNPTNSNAGLFLGSSLRTDILPTITSNIKDIFGEDHVYLYEIIEPNAINSTDGTLTSNIWCNVDVWLFSENAIYGTKFFTNPIPNVGGTFYAQNTMDSTQMALFRQNRRYILPIHGIVYWLRSPAGIGSFCVVTDGDQTDKRLASTANTHIRPYFLLKAA